MVKGLRYLVVVMKLGFLRFKEIDIFLNDGILKVLIEYFDGGVF